MTELLEFLRTHDEAFRSRSRLASLYSDFRFQRSTNPDGYQANSSAWLRALSSAANEGLIPTPSGQAANSRFVLESSEELLRELQTQEFGRPLALGAVLEDAVNSKALIPLKDFLTRQENIYHKSWIPTPWQIVSWGLRQLGVAEGSSSSDKLVKGNFVVVSNVEAAAKQIQAQASKTMLSDADRIFSRDLFSTTFASALDVETFSPNDLSVLLTHLSREQNAIYFDAVSGVVKFKAPGQTLPSPITPEDESIASLRTSIASLNPQIEHLSTRIADLDKAARSAVSEKQFLKAKTALRQKKAAETKLHQRTSTLAQLEDVYAKIEQASDQVQIVKVLEASGQTLKSLNAQTGGVDKVQDVVEGLRESMLDTEEISNAIYEVAAGEVDEGEVEDELEALERGEREKVEARERAEREKREAEEKSEREMLEAEEAKKTRVRLAELGGVPGKEGEEAVQEQDEDMTERVPEKNAA